MKKIRKFLSLSFAQQRLLMKAWILLGVIRLGLELLAFSTLRKLLGRLRPILGDFGKEFSQEQLVWSVGTASRYVPKATCLAQAITAQFLLQRAGHRACLHIGVVKAEKGGLLAHAWVENRDRVLIGGADLNRYTHLSALE